MMTIATNVIPIGPDGPHGPARKWRQNFPRGGQSQAIVCQEVMTVWNDVLRQRSFPPCGRSAACWSGDAPGHGRFVLAPLIRNACVRPGLRGSGGAFPSAGRESAPALVSRRRAMTRPSRTCARKPATCSSRLPPAPGRRHGCGATGTFCARAGPRPHGAGSGDTAQVRRCGGGGSGGVDGWRTALARGPPHPATTPAGALSRGALAPSWRRHVFAASRPSDRRRAPTQEAPRPLR